MGVSKILRPMARLGDCGVEIDMDALRAKAKQKKAEKKSEFIPIDLNEGNVQAIFNRCLAKEDSTETVPAELFPVITGYSAINNESITFDKSAILSNKRTIEYLFGQLYEVHREDKKNRVKFKDFTMTYTGKTWSENKNYLLPLLYLGVSPGSP